jgi:hypothetical protein
MSSESRIIFRSGNADSLQRLVEAICIAELLKPSENLYIYAAWISDFIVLDNRNGMISNLVPELPQDRVRLSDWLKLLAEAGTKICLQTNTDSKNQGIQRRIEYLAYSLPKNRLRIRASQTLHDKGMIGDGYYLRGSFNYTKNGVLVLDEHAEYSTDPTTVAGARIHARQYWEGQED